MLQAKGHDIRDLTNGSWYLSKENAKDMAEDLSSALESCDREKTVVVLQLYDKAVHVGQDEEGNVTKPFKQGKSFHIKGKHAIIGKETMKDVFHTSTPIIKAAGKIPVILMTPLPTYIVDKCCDDETHITNYKDADYDARLSASMLAICKQLRGLVHFRGWKHVNLVGISAGGETEDDKVEEAVERFTELWGKDPVHPTTRAYALISNGVLSRAVAVHKKQLEKVESELSSKRKLESQSGSDGDDASDWSAGHLARARGDQHSGHGGHCAKGGEKREGSPASQGGLAAIRGRSDGHARCDGLAYISGHRGGQDTYAGHYRVSGDRRGQSGYHGDSSHGSGRWGRKAMRGGRGHRGWRGRYDY